MDLLSVNKLVKKLPYLLQNASSYVDVSFCVLEKLLNIGAYSTENAEQILNILTNHTHLFHRCEPKLIQVCLELLQTLASCSEKKLVVCLLQYLPSLIQTNFSSNKQSSEAKKQTQSILDSLLRLVATDRAFLAPSIATMYELVLSERQSQQVFEVSLNALGVVDSCHLASIIRTLLKSAGTSHRENQKKHIETLDHVVFEVRSCAKSLDDDELAPLLVAIADVVKISRPVAFAFLRSFSASLFDTTTPSSNYAESDVPLTLDVSKMDIFILLSICIANGGSTHIRSTNSSSQQYERIQRAIILILIAPTFHPQPILQNAAKCIAMGEPWSTFAPIFVNFLVFLQKWACFVLSASCNGGSFSTSNEKKIFNSNLTQFTITEVVTRCICIIYATIDVQLQLFTQRYKTEHLFIKESLLMELLEGCVQLPNDHIDECSHLNKSMKSSVLIQRNKVLQISRFFLVGAASNTMLMPHFALVCSNVLLQLAKLQCSVMFEFATRIDGVVDRLLHGKNHYRSHVQISSSGTLDGRAHRTMIPSPILHRLMSISTSISASDFNSPRYVSQLIFIRKRLSSFNILNQDTIRNAIYLGSHLVQNLSIRMQQKSIGSQKAFSQKNHEESQETCVLIIEWIFRVANMLTAADLQAAAFDALAHAIPIIERPALIQRILTKCVWRFCVRQQLFSHSTHIQDKYQRYQALFEQFNLETTNQVQYRTRRSGGYQRFFSLKASTVFEDHFLENICNGTHKVVLRIMPTLHSIENEYKNGKRKSEPKIHARAVKANSSTSLHRSMDKGSIAETKGRIQSILTNLSLWRLLLVCLRKSKGSQYGDRTNFKEAVQLPAKVDKCGFDLTTLPLNVLACTHVTLKLPDWLQSAKDDYPKLTSAISKRPNNDSINALWILLHGIAFGIANVIEIVHTYNTLAGKALSSDLQGAANHFQNNRKSDEHHTLKLLVRLVFVALTRVVSHYELALKMIQSLSKRKRKYSAYMTETQSKNLSIQAKAEIIYAMIKNLLVWLSYEVRYRKGFLQLLLDNYSGHIEDPTSERSQGSTSNAITKHAIVTILCLAWGVVEHRDSLEHLDKKCIKIAAEIINVWPLTHSLTDSKRLINLHGTIPGLPMFTDANFVTMLTQSTFWEHALRDFQAQAVAGPTEMQQLDFRSNMAVLLHQLYKCLHAANTSPTNCPELYSPDAFELFMARYATENDANIAMLLLDILDWISLATIRQEQQHKQQREKKQKQQKYKDTYLQRSVKVYRLTVSVTFLGVIPNHSASSKRFAANARAPSPLCLSKSISAAAASTISQEVSINSYSIASYNSRATATGGLLHPSLTKLTKYICNTCSSTWHKRIISSGDEHAYTHHALASMHAKLQTERFLEFAALYFQDFASWMHDYRNSNIKKAKSISDIHPQLRVLSVASAPQHLVHTFDLLCLTLALPTFPFASEKPMQTLVNFEKFEVVTHENNAAYHRQNANLKKTPYSWLWNWIAIYHKFLIDASIFARSQKSNRSSDEAIEKDKKCQVTIARSRNQSVLSNNSSSDDRVRVDSISNGKNNWRDPSLKISKYHTHAIGNLITLMIINVCSFFNHEFYLLW